MKIPTTSKSSTAIQFGAFMGTIGLSVGVLGLECSINFHDLDNGIVLPFNVKGPPR